MPQLTRPSAAALHTQATGQTRTPHPGSRTQPTVELPHPAFTALSPTELYLRPCSCAAGSPPRHPLCRAVLPPLGSVLTGPPCCPASHSSPCYCSSVFSSTVQLNASTRLGSQRDYLPQRPGRERPPAGPCTTDKEPGVLPSPAVQEGCPVPTEAATPAAADSKPGRPVWQASRELLPAWATRVWQTQAEGPWVGPGSTPRHPTGYH